MEPLTDAHNEKFDLSSVPVRYWLPHQSRECTPAVVPHHSAPWFVEGEHMHTHSHHPGSAESKWLHGPETSATCNRGKVKRLEPTANSVVNTFGNASLAEVVRGSLFMVDERCWDGYPELFKCCDFGWHSFCGVFMLGWWTLFLNSVWQTTGCARMEMKRCTPSSCASLTLVLSHKGVIFRTCRTRTKAHCLCFWPSIVLSF